MKLPSNKTPGDDGLSSNIIKACLPTLLNPLHALIDTSFKTGKLPTVWKHATVCPIFKKGDCTDAKNYRPVSLTSTVSKLAERCFLDALLPAIEQCDIIQMHQYGFRKHRSCQDQLLFCLKKITDQLNSPPYKAIRDPQVVSQVATTSEH
jgi:hypothetical protein